MTNKDVHKFYKFLKELPEHHVIMKELLLEYLSVREENKKLYQHIDFLEEQIEIKEKQNELVIH